MVSDPFFGQLGLFSVERRFAHPLVLLVERAIIKRVVGLDPTTIGEWIVPGV